MRTHYQPSGYFDPARLLLAVVALLPLAGLLGWIMSGALAERWYFTIFIPFLAALPLAAAGKKLARWAHVRNPAFAFAIGAALATIMYVGQYYATMVAVLGPQALFRFDIFPDFLVDVLNHHLIIGDDSSRFPGKPSPWENWSVSAVELAMCAFISGWQWSRAARRPYCEQCHRWLGGTTTQLRGGSARKLSEALSNDSLETLPTLEAVFGETPERYGQLEVMGCMHARDGEDANIFVTVSEIVRGEKRSETTVLVDQVAISPDELALIYERCPSLQVEACEA